MRVRCWIKHRVNTHPQGVTKGDVVEILPANADPGRLVYRSHYPVDMDLNVPCGVDFTPPYKCKECENNNPESCDIQKYKSPKISLDDKVEKAREYNVDLDSIIPKELEEIAYKKDNTEQEKALLKAEADSKLFLKTEMSKKTISTIKVDI